MISFVFSFKRHVPQGGCQFGSCLVPETVLKPDEVILDGARIWECDEKEIELIGVGYTADLDHPSSQELLKQMGLEHLKKEFIVPVDRNVVKINVLPDMPLEFLRSR